MLSFKNYCKFLFIAFFTAVLAVSCGKDTETATTITVLSVKDYDYKIANDWNQMFLVTERYAAGFRPGPAPRALAYLGLSAYEACIAGMPNYRSMASLYPGLSVPTVESGKEYHWPTVINASYAYLMPLFFGNATPAQLQAITNLSETNNEKYKTTVSTDVFNRSKTFGEAVSKAIWEWSKTDLVGHDHYKDPFQGYDWQAAYKKVGDWKPTLPGPGKAMGGVWGNARTFAISESDKVCRVPLTYSVSTSSKLYAQALEVYSQNTPTLSYEDEWVGEFWSDDLVGLTFSPGPRWIAIGSQALVKENSTLETALLMNVKVGMALNDASVGCWKSKYIYNVERPQTYINRLIDKNWKPALYNPLTGDTGITPSFPAYPSGHSTMGAAGAEVLASIFGYSYAMIDNCHKGRTEFESRPRSFNSFLEMAEENAWSRVPLGVHYRMDSEEGVHFGTEIGRKINSLPWKKQ